jgi:ABC-2 type transport system permease protein
MLGNFYDQAYLSFKGLYPWLQWWSYISSIWIRPFMTVALCAVVGRFASGSEAAERYILGLTVASMVYVLGGGVLRTFAEDLAQGTLSFVLSSSADRFKLYWARGVPHIVNGLLTFLCCIVTAWLLLDLDFGQVGWLSFCLATLSIGFSTAAFGLLFSSLVIVTREYQNLSQVCYGFLATLTGVVIPVSSLPVVLRQLAEVLPITHGLVALRSAFGGESLLDVAPDLAGEITVGAVLTAAGFYVFRAVERQGRNRGYIEGVAV